MSTMPRVVDVGMVLVEMFVHSACVLPAPFSALRGSHFHAKLDSDYSLSVVVQQSNFSLPGCFVCPSVERIIL